MTERLFIINAFVRPGKPFSGNPAAVCLLESPRLATSMQALAAQMRLSETAFVSPRSKDGSFQLRWFTPAAEVALCGHATLASAHALWTAGVLGEREDAEFETLSGRLTVWRKNDLLCMDFPATPPAPCVPPKGLLDALGLEEALFTGRSRFDILIEVASLDILEALSPDMKALESVDVRGVIVTCKAADIASRFFAPAVGVDEDPVTGSAHCTLAPYWSPRLGMRLHAEQRSRRGGELDLELRGERVIMTGRALTVLDGVLGSVF